MEDAKQYHREQKERAWRDHYMEEFIVNATRKANVDHQVGENAICSLSGKKINYGDQIIVMNCSKALVFLYEPIMKWLETKKYCPITNEDIIENHKALRAAGKVTKVPVTNELIRERTAAEKVEDARKKAKADRDFAAFTESFNRSYGVN